MVVQLGVKLTYSPPFIVEESFLINGDLSFQPVIDGTCQLVGEDGQGLALALLFLQFGQEFLSFGRIPQESDGGFGKGPLEMGLAHVAP